MVYVLPLESPAAMYWLRMLQGTLKVAPLQILKFPVVLPHKFLDAEKFNLRFSDASEDHGNCGQAAVVSLSKRTSSAVTRRTMLASTAVPISITKRQGGTFIRRSIWRSWQSCLRYRWRICWMTITCFCCGSGSADQSHTSAARLDAEGICSAAWRPAAKVQAIGNRVTCRFSNPYGRSISSRHNHSSKRADRLLRLACSFAMYYCCAFRCFTAASTGSSFCSVEQGSFWMDFSACSD